jgi:hypothetical protein
MTLLFWIFFLGTPATVAADMVILFWAVFMFPVALFQRDNYTLNRAPALTPHAVLGEIGDNRWRTTLAYALGAPAASIAGYLFYAHDLHASGEHAFQIIVVVHGAISLWALLGLGLDVLADARRRARANDATYPL